MPVSKKRKKAKQTKHEPKHILVKVDHNNGASAVPFIMYHPFENSKPTIDTVYKHGEPCTVQSDYLHQYTNSQKDRLLDVKKYAESVFNNYITNTKDFDQALNIWHTLSKTIIADTLDFTEFTKNASAENIDAAEKAYDIINTFGNDFDASWLWSTSQYFDIIISPRVMYKLVRIGYNEDRESVLYGFTEYERFNLGSDVYVTIPVMQGVMDMYFDKFFIENTGKIKVKQYGDLNLKSYYDTNVGYVKSIADKCVKKYGNGFNTVRIDLLGDCHVIKIMDDEYKKVMRNKNKQNVRLYNCLFDIEDRYVLSGFAEAERTSGREYTPIYCVLRAMSAITASLIISNKLLKDKKLSKPVKIDNTPAPITVRHEMDIHSLPERKTRVLGGNIKITSAERPATPTMERVIKYHVLEWGRKEHFRRLKSGKIVHVKAAQCTRKCADKTSTKTNQTKQATDYKIKPEQTV